MQAFFSRGPRAAGVAKGPDPRKDTAPLAEVPALVAEGAREYAARRFWHAHEAWERAWHALRAAERLDAAGYLRGMILVAAALENATRGKELGFKRQLAEGLHHLFTHEAGAVELGVRDAPRWERALTALYAEACRRRDWSFWNASGWSAPALEVA